MIDFAIFAGRRGAPGIHDYKQSGREEGGEFHCCKCAEAVFLFDMIGCREGGGAEAWYWSDIYWLGVARCL